MIGFYESSVFTKLFISEPESAALLRLYKAEKQRAVSRLAGLEVRSAVRRLQTSGALTVDEATKARSSLEIEMGLISVVALDEAVLLQAQLLIERNTIRSLDALQLSTALRLQQHSPVTFVSADERLNQAAIAEGLVTLNPRDL